MTVYIAGMEADAAADKAARATVSTNKAAALKIHNSNRPLKPAQTAELEQLQATNKACNKEILMRHRSRSAANALLTKCRTTNCSHGPMVSGPIRTDAHHLVRGQLVYTRTLCDVCDTSKAVTVVAKTVICALCNEPVEDGATDLENLSDAIHRHAMIVHDQSMPCAFLCGAIHDPADVDIYNHWRICHYNTYHQSPTTRSSALRTGVNESNINLRWHELKTNPETAVCHTCKSDTEQYYTVHVAVDSIFLKCQRCTDTTIPTSPISLIDKEINGEKSHPMFRALDGHPPMKARKLDL